MTLAGVGVAVSGTMLEVRQSGISTGRGIDATQLTIVAVLLPAAVAVLVLGISKDEETLGRR